MNEKYIRVEKVFTSEHPETCINITVRMNIMIKGITISLCRPDSSIAARIVICSNHRMRNTMFHIYNDMKDDGISFFDTYDSVFRFSFHKHHVHICRMESFDSDFNIKQEEFMDFDSDKSIYDLNEFGRKYMNVVIECDGYKIDDDILRFDVIRL